MTYQYNSSAKKNRHLKKKPRCQIFVFLHIETVFKVSWRCLLAYIYTICFFSLSLCTASIYYARSSYNAMCNIAKIDTVCRTMSKKFTWVGCESRLVKLFINQPDLCINRHVPVSLCLECRWYKPVGTVCAVQIYIR